MINFNADEDKKATSPSRIEPATLCSTFWQIFLGPLFEWRPEQVWEGCRLEKQPSQGIYCDPGFSPSQDWATEEAMIWPEGDTSNN